MLKDTALTKREVRVPIGRALWWSEPRYRGGVVVALCTASQLQASQRCNRLYPSTVCRTVRRVLVDGWMACLARSCRRCQALFKQKLELCSVIFNFDNANSNKRCVCHCRRMQCPLMRLLATEWWLA